MVKRRWLNGRCLYWQNHFEKREKEREKEVFKKLPKKKEKEKKQTKKPKFGKIAGKK